MSGYGLLFARHARATVHGGRTVHAVRIDDDRKPALICHTGVYGWHPGAVLRATVLPITCRKCLRRIYVGDTGYDPGPAVPEYQPALF